MEILGEDIAMLRTHSRNGWTVSESGSAQKQEKPFGVNMAKRLANTFVPLVHSLISCSKCSSKTVLFIKMMGPFYGSPGPQKCHHKDDDRSVQYLQDS